MEPDRITTPGPDEPVSRAATGPPRREGGATGVRAGTPATAGAAPPRRPALRHHWPAALGLAVAALVLALAVDRETVAITVTVATLCYLGAAAWDRPWVAWAAIPGASLIVTATKLAGLAWWAGLGLAALALVAIGLLRGVRRPTLTAQTAALIGYAGLAVAALFIAPRAGLLLAGVALASHAVWDAVHYRRNRVVPRSLAEFCILLDVPLGAGAVILALID